MKKILTSLALLCAVVTGANAQRVADWRVLVASPEEGSTVHFNGGDSTDVVYYFINNGPDSVIAGDTILFQDPFGSVSLYLDDPAFVVGMGDTVSFARGRVAITGDVDNGPAEWCAAAFVIDGVTNDFMTDPDTMNNVSCNNVTFVNHTTSIGSIKGLAKEAISVYPNPATNNIGFKYNFAANTVATVNVTDVTGRTVIVKELGKQVAGPKEFTLDVSALSNGMYYMELVTDEKRAVSKFNINK